jgi:cytochrome c oxidase assembly protein subunit 11
MSETARPPGEARHLRVALSCFLLVAGMTGLSFAAVPLYRLFCEVTGYGGTTRRAELPSGGVVDRPITVRFDANTASDLRWDFQPVQREITLRIGENSLAFYRATNVSDAPVTGTATFNVTPEIAGSFFNKVECFCFAEQTIQPGQSVEFPVSFFVDPAILNDPDAKRLQEITLSYTFFKVKKSEASVTGAATRSLEKGGPSG